MVRRVSSAAMACVRACVCEGTRGVKILVFQAPLVSESYKAYIKAITGTNIFVVSFSLPSNSGK